TVVAFPVNVSNPGAFTQRVDLTYSGPNSGWLAISATPFTLSPGAFRIVYYNFTIPGTQGPTSFSFDARGAINWSTPPRDRSLTLTLEVNQVYGVLVSSAVSQRSGLPGATVSFNVSVRNNGTGADNFTVQVTNATQAGLVTLSATTLTLVPAGSSQNVTVTVEVQSVPAPAAGSYFYAVTAISSGNVSRSSSVLLGLAVEQTYALGASASPSYRTADPGSPATYTVTVTNNGNGADTVTLQRAGVNQSWVAIATGSASILAGGSFNFTVTATSPSWADAGDTALTVVAVSGGDGNVSSSAAFTISLNPLFQVALQPAGGNITSAHRNTTYIVTFILRNSGNQADTYTISVVGADAAWVTLPGNNYTLNPNENVALDLAVATGPAPSNGNHTFTLTAVSMGSSIPSVSAPFTVSVNDVFRPEVRILAASYPTTPGASVTVAYTLRNNGTLSDVILIEATAHFPTLQQANRTVSLTPGATSTGNFAFTASHPYTGSYLVEIVATSAVEPTASSTARANITLEVIRAFDFQAPVSQAAGGPGDTLVYNLTVRNTGNITDTYSLTGTPYGAGWSVTFSVGEVTLAAGQVANLTVAVAAPAALAGATQQYNHVVAATSTNDTSVRVVLTLAVSVSYSVRLELAGTGADLPLLPGSSGSFTLVLNNTGSARDTYTFAASGLAAPWVTITPPLVSLGALQTSTVTVVVSVPQAALEGGRTFRVTAAPSSGATLTNNELTFTVTVLPVLSFEVTGTDTPVPVVPGQSAVFLVTITNTGNAADTYSLVANLPQYVSFAPTNLSLGAMETGNVSVTYTAPASAAAGQQALRVTVFGSTGAPADVFLNASVLPVHNLTARGIPEGDLSGAAAPGGTVDLTFEVTNRGNGPDIANWTVRGAAAAWTAGAIGFVALPAGASALITLTFTLPADALAGPAAFTVEVVAQGQSASTARMINGTITVGALPGLMFSLDAASDLGLIELTVDRAAPGTLEYTAYLVNTGNRVEELTITRQVPQGQGWTVLIDGASSITLTLAPGAAAEVAIEASGFGTNGENATLTVTVESGDGRIDRSVSVAVFFARGVPFIDVNSLTLSPTRTNAGGAVTVGVTVRNVGPGTLAGLTVELRKDGSLMVDSAPLGVVPPGGTATVLLTWVTSAGDANAPHALSVAIAGRDLEAPVPGTVTVDRVEQGFLQRLTSDTLLPMLLVGGLLVGFVGGFVARGGRRRKAASAPGAPMGGEEAALAGLDELEAEGEGATPAEVAPAAAAGAPAGVEHKVICPNCAMEQWIVGREGECPNCGVLIEVDDGAGGDDEAKAQAG
ncbi:MAG TPA: CARDB domain-containing protein, partial [Candidatus Thermoplasmatota archaeon]